uniref:Secapin n=1 Tax=Odontomachus monticola TaxID=613454 RepID=A0A348G5Z6_ODOMO
MRFYSAGRILSVLLLLVALTCVAEGGSLRARRSFFLNDIGNALNNIGATIKDTMKTGFESVFRRPEEVTLQPDETTLDYRQIINAPIRCPPNHVLVNKRCRFNQGRR